MVEREFERTLPHPHFRCATRTHCKPIGMGTPTPPAVTFAVESQPKGTDNRGCGQKHRETLSQQEQHGVRTDTRITTVVERKIATN